LFPCISFFFIFPSAVVIITLSLSISFIEKPELFANAANHSHPFTSIIRIKLIMDIISSDEENCCSLNLRKIINDGPSDEHSSIIAYYPLHDDQQRDQLNKIWLTWKVKPWQQPTDEVKEYLGEKVALYFEFVGHYTTWLWYLSIAGVFVAIDMAVETALYNSIDEALLMGYTIPFYCIFVSFWAQLMIEYWKRTGIATLRSLLVFFFICFFFLLLLVFVLSSLFF
jgi:hypothetical protein